MKIAYADPPYIGLAEKFYSADPRCSEVNHRDLLCQLEANYNGWALSMHTNLAALKEIIFHAPASSRLAAWVKPFCSFKKNVNPAYTWEPVLFKPARKLPLPTTKDHLICSIAMKRGLVGAKPADFCFWIFNLLGAQPGDEFHDLYPGTGIVGKCWERFSQKKENLQLEVFSGQNRRR